MRHAPGNSVAANSHDPNSCGADILCPDSLFAGLSVYQDVVVAGQTVRRGTRDCQARWELLEPHLPQAGPVLDIGSNFGWFGLQICRTRPECVVARVEADERSAEVQRRVLASHDHRRICLLTARAGTRLIDTFAEAGQRFAACLCLSVLHWIPRHRAFLSKLAEICDTILIEYPDARELGAGDDRIRREIGDIGTYLRTLLPNHTVECIGKTESHRSELPRSVWKVFGGPDFTLKTSAKQGRALVVLGPLRRSSVQEIDRKNSRLESASTEESPRPSLAALAPGTCHPDHPEFGTDREFGADHGCKTDREFSADRRRAGIDAFALLRCDVAWPPRDWWLSEWQRQTEGAANFSTRENGTTRSENRNSADSANRPDAAVSFTAAGLTPDPDCTWTRRQRWAFPRLIQSLPQFGVTTRRRVLRRAVRRVGGRLFRAINLVCG